MGDKAKESDQPNEDLESKDQPDLESEEQEDDSEDQPEEEESEDNLVEVDGEKIPLDELRKGYLRQKDYTKKTQDLSARERELAAKGKEKELPTEQQEVISQLKQLGVATTSDIETTVRRMMVQQQLNTEREEVRIKHELDDDMLYAAQALALRKGVPLREAAELLTGTKVIKKKSLSVQGGKSTPVEKGTSGEITPEYIKSLNLKDPKDKKKFDEIRTKMEKGEL